ncbi:endonuclease/exonuclease/phosphatase family protein [Flocculibacter collagenilyticus]|uniref:endonuclease/exonuclease/phosphatase family protein n=1 Tax=Flocculibacter collagenilyticus TaxID=2744479 RepID=UPI0018F51E40|nr:endonuclease/exonuclease/phosphatase family protein [Flocculibacter collagenilyticus]
MCTHEVICTFTYLTLAAFTLALIIFTLLPIWRYEAWWVRACDFPRFQFLVMALLLILFEAALLDYTQPEVYVLMIAALLCGMYQIWWIFPYTPWFKKEVKSTQDCEPSHEPEKGGAISPADPSSIRILTANVLTTNRNAQGLLDLVHKYAPDVLVTLESDEWWQSQLDTLEPEYMYTIKCPLDNLYGMHVYSRLPLNDCKLEYIVEEDVPSMHTFITLPCGAKIRAHFLHPAPPSPTENDESSERDAELIVIAKSVKNRSVPVIVTGDLNDVAWSATTRLFRKISGLLDPRVGRGMFNTFHAEHWFMRWPLDHLFHSSHFTLTSIKRLPQFGSDHFPLLTELAFHATDNEGQRDNGLEADVDDHQWAQEKVEQEGVAHKHRD